MFSDSEPTVVAASRPPAPMPRALRPGLVLLGLLPVAANIRIGARQRSSGRLRRMLAGRSDDRGATWPRTRRGRRSGPARCGNRAALNPAPTVVVGRNRAAWCCDRHPQCPSALDHQARDSDPHRSDLYPRCCRTDRDRCNTRRHPVLENRAHHPHRPGRYPSSLRLSGVPRQNNLTDTPPSPPFPQHRDLLLSLTLSNRAAR